MLAFVPRPQLGKVVPKIGDRKFASIIQKFLHEYGEITIDCIQIVAPDEEDPEHHPRVRTWQNNRPWKFEMAEVQMPANIKNLDKFELRFETNFFPIINIWEMKFHKWNLYLLDTLTFALTMRLLLC
jgi:hypothetical protein